MNSTLVLLFFLATAPVGLMPSIIALLTRHKSRKLIVLINLVLWGLIFLGARNFSIGASSAFQLPTLLALAAWLVLVGFSIRGASSQNRPA